MQYVYWGSMVEERDGCLEGTPNWRIARFGWDVFVERRNFCFGRDAKLAHSAVWLGCVCGRTGLLFGGDAELAHSAIPLGVFVSLWVE